MSSNALKIGAGVLLVTVILFIIMKKMNSKEKSKEENVPNMATKSSNSNVNKDMGKGYYDNTPPTVSDFITYPSWSSGGPF